MESGGFQRVEFREYMDILLIADSYRKGSERARTRDARRIPVRLATIEQSLPARPLVPMFH